MRVVFVVVADVRRPRPGPTVRVETDPLIEPRQIIKARGTWRRLGEPGFSLFATPMSLSRYVVP